MQLIASARYAGQKARSPFRSANCALRGLTDCEPSFPKNHGQALSRAPYDLVELPIRQLQRLSDTRSRLFGEVIAYQHLAIALNGQMPNQTTNTRGELLMIETLFDRQSLIPEVRQQLVIAVVPT